MFDVLFKVRVLYFMLVPLSWYIYDFLYLDNENDVNRRTITIAIMKHTLF
jgi:hypothetical protein